MAAAVAAAQRLRLLWLPLSMSPPPDPRFSHPSFFSGVLSCAVGVIFVSASFSFTSTRIRLFLLHLDSAASPVDDAIFCPRPVPCPVSPHRARAPAPMPALVPWPAALAAQLNVAVGSFAPCAALLLTPHIHMPVALNRRLRYSSEYLTNQDYEHGGMADWSTGMGTLSVYINDMLNPVFTIPLNLGATLVSSGPSRGLSGRHPRTARAARACALLARAAPPGWPDPLCCVYSAVYSAAESTRIAPLFSFVLYQLYKPDWRLFSSFVPALLLSLSRSISISISISSPSPLPLCVSLSLSLICIYMCVSLQSHVSGRCNPPPALASHFATHAPGARGRATCRTLLACARGRLPSLTRSLVCGRVGLQSLENGRAWIGFTAATGESIWQAHDILSWQYRALRETPPQYQPAIINDNGPFRSAAPARRV